MKGPTEFAIRLDALSRVIEIADEHGREIALTVWEQAEADAITSGADHVDASRIERTYREYLSQE